MTDEPEPLLKGFSKAERVLKHLFVQKLYLWPRFHISIAETLAASQPETIELVQPLSANTGAIQQAILVAMDACMQELRRALPHIDLTEMTLQNGLLKVCFPSASQSDNDLSHDSNLTCKYVHNWSLSGIRSACAQSNLSMISRRCGNC